MEAISADHEANQAISIVLSHEFYNSKENEIEKKSRIGLIREDMLSA
jgi:hypothetical protein